MRLIRRPRRASRVLVTAAAAIVASATLARAQQSSEPAMLQWFEVSQATIEKRAADFHAAGYGGVWVPPQTRSEDSGSVGYNVYDRFDLGKPNDPTQYGTEAGLKSATRGIQRAGGSMFVDLILNHSGFRDNTTTSGGVRFSPNPANPSQLHGGGYPGFVMGTTTLPNGEYHPANVGTSATNPQYDYQFRVSGLNDLDQRVELSYVRNPVPGNPLNIPNPANATIFGRRANVPDAANTRFYADTSLPGQTFTDPRTGGTYTVYPYNKTTPGNGTPVAETVNGYLARNAQWMIQAIGVDGFRIDTAKHIYPSVLDWYDRGVFRADLRKNLDGSQRNVFSFLEYYDGDPNKVSSIIRKDIVNGSSTVGGNRDALDFPLFFAMRNNLGSTATANNWHGIRNASVDFLDDGNANNGTRGVSFVTSHDDGGMFLSNVAHAFALMRPGKALVYTNGHQFGNRAFPQEGRTDALGGFYGNTVTKLVEIRNTHGRGNFAERWIDDAFNANGFSNVYIYDRQNSALVALNSAFGNTVDTRSGVQTSFAAGTHLVELTGNADDVNVDVTNTIPNTITVAAGGLVNVSIPRNTTVGTTAINKGYVIYGLQNPKGTMALTNVTSTIAGETATAATNGTQRLSSISVVTGNNFDVNLNTLAITLPDGFRDKSADGDRAYVKIDEGLDLNNSGTVDFRTPGATTYGFENFNVTNAGFNQVSGAGSFSSSIDTTKLSEGYHYLTARAYRQRSDGGPDVFSDFKKTIYVDRLKPVSAVESFDPFDSGTVNRDLDVQSVDQTATSVQVLMDQPANLTDAQILAIVGTSNNVMTKIDRDLFRYGFTNTASGNHAFTIVTREITGNVNVQRITGVNTLGTRGKGVGDLDFNNNYNITDVNMMKTLVYPNAQGQTNTAFNPAADLNADGLIDSNDLYGMRDRYEALGAGTVSVTGMSSVKAAVLERGDVNADGATDAADITFLQHHRGDLAWTYDLNASEYLNPGHGSDRWDVDTLVRVILRSQYGDADLNGKIDTADFDQVDNSFTADNSTNGGNGPGAAMWSDGDFNGDGDVNGIDYAIIDYYYLLENESGSIDGSTPGIGSRIARAVRYLEAGNPNGDRSMLNDQYLVNVHEHFGQFGQPYANAFLAEVPEPTSVALIALTSLAVMRRRSRRR